MGSILDQCGVFYSTDENRGVLIYVPPSCWKRGSENQRFIAYYITDSAEYEPIFSHVPFLHVERIQSMPSLLLRLERVSPHLVIIDEKIHWAGSSVLPLVSLIRGKTHAEVLMATRSLPDPHFVRKAYRAGVSDILTSTPYERESWVESIAVLLKINLKSHTDKKVQGTSL